MRFASVCSGIGAAELAFSLVGWECVFSSEIEAFPSAVLAHRFNHPNMGDFTKIGAQHGTVDLLVGGTPCQSFSVAGKRLGLDDPRGNLALEYLALARRLGVRWLVWENVPGVLSSNGGRDFGAFLGTLGELGYGWAYRVLDAQYFGVAQRRRRVFVVGCLGDWRRAAAVLFEPESVRGDPAPRREKGKGVAATVGTRAARGSGDLLNAGGLIPETAPTLDCRSGRSGETAFHTSGGLVPEVSPVLTARMQGSSGWAPVNETAHLVPEASWWDGGQTAQTLTAGNDPSRSPQSAEVTEMVSSVFAASMAVRRLTPRECERLQGFPDDWTAIPWRKKFACCSCGEHFKDEYATGVGGLAPAECPRCGSENVMPDTPDGPRYRAIGNSMAVPVMEWLARRIQAVEEMT